MSGKKVFLALFSVLIIGWLANAGFAQQDTGAGNFLDAIFQPFAGIDLAKTYDLAPNFIDAMFYFLFFIGITQFALSGYFKGKGGTAVIIAFGAALAIGLAVWTSRIGFRLGDRIGPIAGAIFAILFFVLMVRLFKGDGEWGPAFWIAYLFGFVFINFFVPEVFSTFNETKYGRIVIGIANLLFFISLVYGVPRFLSKFWGGGGKKEGEEGAGRGFGGLFGGRGRGREGEPEDEEEKKARELTRREQKLLDNLIKTDVSSLNTDVKVRDYLQKLKDYLIRIEETGLRLVEIVPNIRKLKDVITNRKQRDKNIRKIMDRNRALLKRIIKTLNKEEGFTEEDLKKELKSAIDGKNKLGKKHVSVYRKLLEEEKKADNAARVEAYLNNIIEKEDEERIELFDKIGENLEDIMIELQKDEPDVGKVRDNLHETIYYIEEVIVIDRKIIEREEEMYKKNKFLDIVLGEEEGDIGGPGPRI